MKRQSMNAVTSAAKNYLCSQKSQLFVLATAIVLMVFSSLLHAADQGQAVDHLAGIKPGVKSTFGHGSTFEWLIYIAQAAVCSWRYLSTQNIAWFVGMPLIMVFTYVYLN